MIARLNQNIETLLGRDDLIESAVQASVRSALAQHAAAGNPIAEWRDGRVLETRPTGSAARLENASRHLIGGE